MWEKQQLQPHSKQISKTKKERKPFNQKKYSCSFADHLCFRGRRKTSSCQQGAAPTSQQSIIPISQQDEAAAAAFCVWGDLLAHPEFSLSGTDYSRLGYTKYKQLSSELGRGEGAVWAQPSRAGSSQGFTGIDLSKQMNHPTTSRNKQAANWKPPQILQYKKPNRL